MSLRQPDAMAPIPHTVTVEEIRDFMSQRAVVPLASSSGYGNYKALTAIVHADGPPTYEVTIGRGDGSKTAFSTLAFAVDLYNQAP